MLLCDVIDRIILPRLEESKLYNRGDKIRNRNLWITNIIKMIDSWTTIDSELHINDEILHAT